MQLLPQSAQISAVALHDLTSTSRDERNLLREKLTVFRKTIFMSSRGKTDLVLTWGSAGKHPCDNGASARLPRCGKISCASQYSQKPLVAFAAKTAARLRTHLHIDDIRLAANLPNHCLSTLYCNFPLPNLNLTASEVGDGCEGRQLGGVSRDECTKMYMTERPPPRSRHACPYTSSPLYVKSK